MKLLDFYFEIQNIFTEMQKISDQKLSNVDVVFKQGNSELDFAGGTIIYGGGRVVNCELTFKRRKGQC